MIAKKKIAKKKTVRRIDTESTAELTGIVLQACLVAKDSAFNLRDYIENTSHMAFLAVKDCEKELDRMERRVDEEITSAITQVSEAEARQLLACLKFIIDLERVGDLTWSVTQRLQRLNTKLTREDARDLILMCQILEIDAACRSVFHRHLETHDRQRREYSTNLMFMAQAFERAGDHAKNLGEELFHLVEGRSLRHEPKKSKSRSAE